MSTNFLGLARLAIEDAWNLALDTLRLGDRWGVAIPVIDDRWGDETCKEQILEAQAIFHRDPRAGFQAYADLAHAGSVWCMIRVGWCHETGKSTPRDLDSAKRCYAAALEQGSEEAGLRLLQLQLRTEAFY